MADTTYTQQAYSQAPYVHGRATGYDRPASGRPATGAAGVGPEAGYEPDIQNAPPERAGASGVVNILGAMMSIALLLGVGVWGYRLLSRDVSGLPVVRAVEGPMRVQPDDPGGQEADHQGLAVNAVAAHGSAAPTADRLVLAPQPVVLVDEDEAGQTAPAVRSAAVESDTPDTPAPVEQPAEQLAEQPALSPDVARLVDQLTAHAPASGTGTGSDSGTPQQVALVAPEVLIDPASEEAVAGAETPSDEPATDQIPETVAEPEIVSGPGLARSLRPLARPERPAAVTQSGTPEATPASLDVDPGSLPAGTRLAQLGAYDSAEVARVEWDRLHARFIDYMDGKQRVIQQATSGGRTFYRLRAMGFSDLSDARRFCAVLVAAKADCIPVTTR